ncbi:hypothetical protein D3C84_1233540 [compost metagenome]
MSEELEEVESITTGISARRVSRRMAETVSKPFILGIFMSIIITEKDGSAIF